MATVTAWVATAADALTLAALAPEARLAELADATILAADMVEDATVDVTVDAAVDAAEDAEATEADAVDEVVEETETPADDVAKLETLEVPIDDDTEVEDAPDFKAELCKMLDEVFNALDELCNMFDELWTMLVDDSIIWIVSTVFFVPCDTASPPPKLSSLDLCTAEKRFTKVIAAPANIILPTE